MRYKLATLTTQYRYNLYITRAAQLRIESPVSRMRKPSSHLHSTFLSYIHGYSHILRKEIVTAESVHQHFPEGFAKAAIALSICNSHTVLCGAQRHYILCTEMYDVCFTSTYDYPRGCRERQKPKATALGLSRPHQYRDLISECFRMYLRIVHLYSTRDLFGTNPFKDSVSHVDL